MRSFAGFLRQDLDEWSSGKAEGNVNRVKTPLSCTGPLGRCALPRARAAVPADFRGWVLARCSGAPALTVARVRGPTRGLQT
jgi:hypothetical protein